MRRKAFTLLLIPTLCLACSCSMCGMDQECFDPDDPCPNDMVTDESGCVWDQCSGEFTGNLLPCSLFLDFSDGIASVSLAGVDSEYIVFIEIKEDTGLYAKGPIWLYEIATGTKTPLTSSDRLCFDLETDGERIAWRERVEGVEGEGPLPVTDVYAMDILSGQQWHVPNPDHRDTQCVSISGDDLVLTEVTRVQCDVYFDNTSVLYHYDLSTEEKTILDESVLGEYMSACSDVQERRVVYRRVGGACSDAGEWLRLRDLDSGDDYELASFSSARVFFFDFDGRWLVFSTRATIEAIDVDSLEHVLVTECGHGDCIFRLNNGRIFYDRYGEDGLDQYQLYVKEVGSEERTKTTDLRPYYDNGVPSDFESGRLLWKESRGRNILDTCGNSRLADGLTWLVFWKDIDF